MIDDFDLVDNKLILKSRVIKPKQKIENLTFSVEDWIKFVSGATIRSSSLTNFNPYDYQIEMVREMFSRSIVVCKSRQTGVSETISSWMLFRAFIDEGYLGLIFSKTQDDTSLIARRVRRMMNSLGIITYTDNLQDIELVNGGRLLFRNSLPDRSRGIESVNEIFYDEAGFCPLFEETRSAIAPAQEMIGSSAREFVVSTSNGKRWGYWNLLNGGQTDLEKKIKQINNDEIPPFTKWVDSDGWSKILIHWKAHPIYGKKSDFLLNIHDKRKLSWNTINREYNMSFDTQVADAAIQYFTTKCVFNVPIEVDSPVEVSFDFNVNPAVALLAQVQNNKIVIFDEVYLNEADTFKSAMEVCKRLNQLDAYYVKIYGDASGNARTANSQFSNWQIVINEFVKCGLKYSLNVPRKNPPIIDTINTINSLFIDDRIIISPKCKETLLDITTVELKSDGSIDKSDSKRSHLFDALRYLCYTIFPYR